MGCSSSKRVEASAVDDNVYRHPPTSIAVFDINTVEEPWLITKNQEQKESVITDQSYNFEQETIKKPAIHVPLSILEKLESTVSNGDGNQAPPQLSWSEVSKALHDLKESDFIEKKPITLPKPQPKPNPQPPRKSTTFSAARDAVVGVEPPPELTGRRPVKENSFIIKDRMEREANKVADMSKIRWKKPNPFEGYEERKPPGNPDGLVLYTTTLRGVRRTFEDCERARRVVYPNAVEAGVEVDERDVSLHGEFLKEVRELVGEGELGGKGIVPRLFVKGRYVGGTEEMVGVDESGKMREMMRVVARASKNNYNDGKGGTGGGGWMGGCEGCGGARFVPCMECSGSCKVVGEDGKEVVRCGDCNENGLIMCPLCH